MGPVSQILVTAAMAALAVLLALSAVIGGAVALRPDLLDRLRRPSERRYSLRRATRVLDTPRNVDRWFYRHHRPYGAVVVALAVFLLYFLVFGELRPGWQGVFGPQYREVVAIALYTARIVLWLLAIFALVVGTVVFVRPSALRGFEAWANRWLSLRPATSALDREYDGLDRWLARRPRLWGALALVLSVICLLALGAQWQAAGLAG